jgi:hypothetical protein
MKKIILFLIFLALFQSKSFTQNKYDKTWLFGYGKFTTDTKIDGVQMTFDDNNALVEGVSKNIFLAESLVCISDSMGKLQFYSNGCNIYNSKHKVVEKGDSIGKGIFETSYCTSIETSSIPAFQMLFSTPRPGYPNQYYFFSSNLVNVYKKGDGFPLAPTKLYYSIVDMNQNNGDGKVIIKHHEILSDTFSRSMMHGVMHKNKKDWWLVMPKSRSNCYFVILIGENGVKKVKKQCGGLVWNDKDTGGQAVFSPNRKYYARIGTYNKLNLYDFNNETGELTPKESILVHDEDNTAWSSGAAFSPNSQYLYATDGLKIHQYDINSNDILKSHRIVALLSSPPDGSGKTQFNNALLARNGKIYIAGQATYTFLHVIDKPNLEGFSCDVKQYAIPLPCYAGYGLPNYPHFKDWEQEFLNLKNNEQTEFNMSASPNPNQGSFDFSLEGEAAPNVTVTVMNTFGQILEKRNCDFSEGELQTRFELNALPSGAYILQVSQENKRAYLRFMKE